MAVSKAQERKKRAQDVLRVPVRKSKSRVARWFKDHPEAAEFLATWLEMRVAGDSTWSVAHVLQHLRGEWHFPFKSYANLSTWIKNTWPAEWQAAIDKMREEQK